MTEIKPNFYTIIGVPPEVNGYGMAKTSRSAQHLKEMLRDITSQSAADFYENFYHQYGHKSIADLAHIQLAADNISIVSAILLFDDPLVDGQESSTRYQNFYKRRFVVPTEILGSRFEKRYTEFCNKLFITYLEFREPVANYLSKKFTDSKPADLDEETASKTLNARALDRIRYLLPGATLTNVYQVFSARTAERMLIKLASSPVQSVRALGEGVRGAIKDHPAFNLVAEQLETLVKAQPDYGERKEFYQHQLEIALKGVRSAPTLVKYTGATKYQQWVYGTELKRLAQEFLGGSEPEKGRGVRLYTNLDPEVEAVATALFKGSTHSFNQAIIEAGEMGYAGRKELIKNLFSKRDLYDEPIQELSTGRGLIFDIEIDNGAFRDLNRHRNNIKIVQDMTAELGFDMPEDFAAAGLEGGYKEVCGEAAVLAGEIEEEFPGIGQYVLPLAFRRKFLMKMDSGQLQYIVENRTPPDRHFSYREICYKMYRLAKDYSEVLTNQIRVTRPSVENFWKR